MKGKNDGSGAMKAKVRANGMAFSDPGGIGPGMVKPRKRMGMGTSPSGASDVQSLADTTGGRIHPDIKGGKTASRVMRDGQRNAPIRYSRSAGNQANPDHGDSY